MNRDLMSHLAHADHPIADPLGDDTVQRLLRRAVPVPDARVLDLGCGGGEWLLRTLAAHPEARAVGVDLSEPALARARAAAETAGAGDRLTLHRADAAAFTDPAGFDLVLCLGVAHVFGGLLPTLAAAREHLAPGGRVLVGDAYWQAEPSPAAVEMLGEGYTDLHSTVDRVVAAGWTPVYGHTSTRHELDDYEWNWTGSLAAWALDHPEDPDSADALKAADAHRREWAAYRDAFGFVSLVLRPTP
ncbi:SAM-dependent methyltransferase [Streptomyces solincola]|uniref:SAM-dependent methyltransferase n=1 Tax=Streptomyces solincola TaxID=2100817 RepID=A0A2S9PXE1_9ACTN|nr:class I SAM-dependent methyltransferase [Streptomyces solincola]PRH79088.1 SAM-dependent methyltransferase [Streptomyces solincola]